jgi:iron(III) transport system ATP-binding protein
MNELELQDAHHRYTQRPVLDGVDLEVEKGSFVAVLGSSGSGKTTLLRVIAGFERLESGSLRVGGVTVDDGRRATPPEKRKIGYVPQEGALFPHLRVAANVAFGLGRKADRARIGRLLEMVGLSGLERRYPHELSGGQQQRVALARALAVEPDLVLLDEPFSALDAALRASLRQDVAQILRERGTTSVLVTHDQDEALSMADRVAVLRDGRIVADAHPELLYQSPVDADLASFVGDANLLSGTVAHGTVATSLGRLVVRPGPDATEASDNRDVTVLVRPEQIELRAPSAAPASGGVPGLVTDRAYFGHDALLHVSLERSDGGRPEDHQLLVRVTGIAPPDPGSRVLLTVRGPVTAWPTDPAVTAS